MYNDKCTIINKGSENTKYKLLYSKYLIYCKFAIYAIYLGEYYFGYRLLFESNRIENYP